jgi:hypothetical protein
VALCEPRALPKTSSGKKRRLTLRAAYLSPDGESQGFRLPAEVDAPARRGGQQTGSTAS